MLAQAPNRGSHINSYILYISAYVPDGPSDLRQSPWCTLDNFVGHADERKAPQWMRWRKSSICFTHKTASIARLLKKMASWKVNTDQVSNFILLLVHKPSSLPRSPDWL